MCLCHQAVQFGTGQRAVMLCGREGNPRSGVALAMRHTLVVLVYPPTGSTATERDMSTPPTLQMEHGPLYFFYSCCTLLSCAGVCRSLWRMSYSCRLQLSCSVQDSTVQWRNNVVGARRQDKTVLSHFAQSHFGDDFAQSYFCLLYTSPSPRD